VNANGNAVKETDQNPTTWVGTGVPGPGRPKGVPNRATTEMKEFALWFLTDETHRSNLRARILAGKADHIETLLWLYVYGRPKETIKLEGEQRRPFLIVLPGHGQDPLEVEAEPVDQPDRKLPALPAKMVEINFELQDFEEPRT